MNVQSEVTMTIRLRDIDRFRLFIWELRMLADQMRVMASPHSEALERAIDRFVEGGDDECPEEKK
jgi:hypothetical protein